MFAFVLLVSVAFGAQIFFKYDGYWTGVDKDKCYPPVPGSTQYMKYYKENNKHYMKGYTDAACKTESKEKMEIRATSTIKEDGIPDHEFYYVEGKTVTNNGCTDHENRFVYLIEKLETGKQRMITNMTGEKFYIKRQDAKNFIMTPPITCDAGKNQKLNEATNECDCMEGFTKQANNATVPCFCNATTHEVKTENGVKKCVVKQVTCDAAKGQKKHATENKCECDTTKGFKENTGADKTTKPCVCATNGHNIIKTTGANNVVTYSCAACPSGQTYNAQKMVCEAAAVTCDAAKYQKKHATENRCECMTGFTENTGTDKTTKPCVCTAAEHYIIKESATAYKCAKCEGATIYYNETAMQCRAPNAAELENLKTLCVKDAGAVWNETEAIIKNKCICNATLNFVKNTNTTAGAPTCVCAANFNWVETKNGGATTVECKKCEAPTPVYNATTKQCEAAPTTTPVTCDAKLYQIKHASENKCVCMSGFVENTGTDKTTKPCVCTAANHHILNKTGAANTLTYECATCGNDKPFYDDEKYECVTTEATKAVCLAQAGATWAETGNNVFAERCTCGKPNFEKDGNGKLCKCKANFNWVETKNGGATTVECKTCEGNTPFYNTTGKVCEACPADKPFYNTTGKVCEACSGDKPFYNTTGKVCEACSADKPFYNTTGKVCEACPTDKPFYNTTGKVCEACPTDKPLYNTTSKACEACPSGQTYDTANKVCKPATVTCDAKIYQIKHASENKCVCMTGFTENTGADKGTKPCVCTTANYNILNKTGASSTLTYECAACPQGQTYNTQTMACGAPKTAEQTKRVAKPADNKYECDKCYDDGRKIYCSKYGAKKPDNGVNGLFVVLAMALFFLF